MIIPDFNASTLRDFISLTYGLKNPENIDRFTKIAIFELCQTLGMCLNKSSETVTTITNLEEEVTTEDVERLLNAVEQHQVTMTQIFTDDVFSKEN